MTYTTFERAFDRLRYPAGERHLRARDLGRLHAVETIEAPARNFEDLLDLLVADRLLRRHRITVEWFVPYFPFARHDRRFDEADGFELGLALELVSELDLVVADPHSDVTAVLPHIPQSSVVEVMRSVGAFDANPIVVVPDAGATRKAGEWVGAADVVQAHKRRDPRTGRLDDFGVVAEGLDGRPCVIVDDICDGGGTFLGLAELLRSRHDAGPLSLIVTHGLFTKGLDALSAAFDRIYTFGPTDEVPIATTAGRVTRLPFRVLHEKGQRR